MQLELAAVVARLAEGEAPDAILARPSGERELFKRVAIVRSFDRRLFGEVIAPDVGEADVPPFDDFVQSPDVEPLPRTDGVFQLVRAARKANWDAWSPGGADTDTVPKPLRRFLTRLVSYYRTTQSPVDELAHLALVNERDALTLFRQLFRAVDDRFDLAACQDLVDVLNDPDRARFIGAQLGAARDDRIAYLGARSLWSSEYYQAEDFLETKDVRSVYEELVAGEGFRVLDLHAPGGRGKTIQLRWLIARQLVPEFERETGHPFGNGRILCAKVDFDFIDPVNATRYPWLVLVEAAAQLNDQLTRKWFNELLGNAGWAIPLLRRTPTDPSRAEAASKRMRTEGAVTGEGVVRGFWRNLNEATGERPVVLVFDTLEEVHLRPQGDLRALLELVAEMLGKCPGLRLILSGRYSVSRTLGDAAGALAPLREVLVSPFTDADGNRYLRERRYVRKTSIRRAIVEKAGENLEEPGCDPLVLSLLADEVQARPKLTPAQIARYPADVIRLISRIVSRIHEPGVRWILRYGVVPRSLTLTFVRDVMEPHLRLAMAGAGALDAPKKDELPTELEPDVEHFPRVLASPDAPLDLEALWASLRNYASSTSWVYPDPADEQVLRFRADVAVPMREIVRRHPVFRRLHRDAAAYFEHKAEHEPEQWPRWTREAIYHRFQLRGPAAAAFWRRSIQACGRADLESRAAIAAELLETDYVDEEGQPRAWERGKTILNRRTLLEAHYEHACALSELARVRGAPPDDQLWSSVHESLAAVEQGQANLDRPVVSATGLAYLHAGLALKDGRVGEAEARLAEAIRRARKGPDFARLLTLLGDVELARGDRAAPERYAQARRAISSSDRAELAELDLRLLVAHLAIDQLDEAYEAYRRALAGIDQPRRGQLRLQGALIGLGSGQFTWADETAAAALDEAADWDAWVPRVFAALARFAPVHASGLAAAAEEAAGTATSGALDPSAQAAWGRELTGIAAGELMQFDEAFGALENARSAWQSQGDAEGVVRCQVRSAALKLRGTGDVKTAERHLKQAEDVLGPAEAFVLGPASRAWLEARLMRAELHRHLGQRGVAASHTRSTIDMLREASAPPRRLVPAAIACLATADPADRPQLLELVVDQSELMTPASARLVALWGLGDVPELLDEKTRGQRRKLLQLARVGGRSRLAATDRGVLHLSSAELERLSGNRAAAARRLATAREHLSQGGSRFFLREWWLAVDRLGKRPEGVSPSRDAQAFVKELDDFPLLCVAFLVERLEAMAPANRRGARQLLERAEPLLERVAEEETHWHARLLEAGARLQPRAATQGRRDLAGTAADIFVGLGDSSRARVTPRTAPGEPLSELEAKRARLTLALGPEGLQVEARVPPGAAESPPPSRGPLMRLVEESLRISGRASSFELEDMFSSDPSRAAVELGALLYPAPTLDALRRADNPMEVCLEIEDLHLNLLPWELAQAEKGAGPLAAEPRVAGVSRASSHRAARRDEIRFLQIALRKLLGSSLPVDGHFGPASGELLRRYQERRGFEPDGTVTEPLLEAMQIDLAAGSEPPLVILAQPSAFSQVEGQRGKLGLGVDTGRIYEANGFEVRRVEDPSLAQIHDAIEHSLSQKRVPAVLHLSGGLRESGGVVAFTFAAGEWYSEAFAGSRPSDELPVTAVDDLLRAFPRESFRPLVILDADRPPGITETVNQLLLRNVFAGELFALGRCPAVIGTGLADEGSTGLYEPFVGMLARGAPIGETCQRARWELTRSERYLAAFIPDVAIALFTHLPWLRPVIR